MSIRVKNIIFHFPLLRHLHRIGSVADPDRFGPDPDPTSENRPDPDSDPDPVKTGSGSGFI